MSRFRSGDSTVPTAECHASSVILAPFRGQGISPTRIQAHVLGARRKSFQTLPIVRYSGQACWSPKTLVKWVLSDVQMTGTIVAPAAGDLAYATTNRLCSSSCIFGDFPRMQGAPVQTRGAPEMGDVPKGTVYIWKYPGIIMFRRSASDLQSNSHCQAWNRV